MNPYFDIFGKVDRDDSMTEFEYIEYLPRDSNNMNKDGQHIVETKDLDEYLLPHKSLIEVRGRLVKNDGTDYNPEDDIALVNNGWSLFKTVEYQLDNHSVERIDNYAPTASTILNLVQFSDDYGRSTATNMLWYRDTGNGSADASKFIGADTLLPDGANDNQGGNAAGGALKGIQVKNALARIGESSTYNLGFASRKAIGTGEKDVCMYLPISSILGSCKDIDTVFMGVKHSLLLTRASPNNYIHRRNGVAAGMFHIKHLSWWIPKVRPSLKIQSHLESKLVKGHLRDLYFEQVRIYRNQFGATEVSPSWRVTTNSNEELPTHVFVAIQAVGRDNNQEQNNQVFDNAKLKSMAVYINSERYPERELELDFSLPSRNYGRAYMMFQEAVQKYADVDSGSQLSAEDYASLYPIMHFDVSKHREKLRNSAADIEIRWRLASRFEYPPGTASSYNVYCLVLSERFLKLEALSGKMHVIV